MLKAYENVRHTQAGALAGWKNETSTRRVNVVVSVTQRPFAIPINDPEAYIEHLATTIEPSMRVLHTI